MPGFPLEPLPTLPSCPPLTPKQSSPHLYCHTHDPRVCCLSRHGALTKRNFRLAWESLHSVVPVPQFVSVFKRSQQLSLHRCLGGVCKDATASALIPWTTLSSPSPTGQVMALQQPLPSVPSCSLSMWFLHLFSFACPLPQCLSHRRRVSRHSFDDCISPFPHGAPELYGWNGLFPGPQSLPFRPTRRDLPDSKCPGLLFVFLCCGLTYCQPILLGRATLGYL